MGCTNLTYINLCNFDLMNVKANNMFFGCNNLINVYCINIDKENYNGSILILNNKYILSNNKVNIYFYKNNGRTFNVVVPINTIIADLLFNFYLKNGFEDKLHFIFNASDISQNLDKEINKVLHEGAKIDVIG